MFRTTLIPIFLALAAPALAAGPTAPTDQVKAPTPAPKRKSKIENNHDYLVRVCREAGGGASTGEDGVYHCIDPQGRDIW